MTGEHLDDETTAPAEWEPIDWYDLLATDGDPADYGLRRVQDLRTAPGLLDATDPTCATLAEAGECLGQWRCGGSLGCIFGAAIGDELRPADFDDEERP
jgi:hypothetical protein